MTNLTFDGYDTTGYFDEMFLEDGSPRQGAERLLQRINSLPPGELRARQQEIESALLRMGITFTVYGDQAGTEKIFPFDVIPRIVQASDWRHI